MSSGNLSDTESTVLAHIGRYRLTFKELLAHLYFDDADPQKVLDRLRKNELIRTIKGFGGNRSAYVLTPQGTAAAHVSSKRADAAKREAMPIHRAILSYCFLCGRPRARLERLEILQHLGLTVPDQHRYAFEYSTKAKRLCHLYVPDDNSTPRDIAATTRRHIAQHRKRSEFEPWLTNRVLSFTILVDDQERQEKIQRALDAARDEDRSSLGHSARFDVVKVPGPNDLEEAFRGLSQTD